MEVSMSAGDISNSISAELISLAAAEITPVEGTPDDEVLNGINDPAIAYADIVRGNGGRDTLNGGAGDDTLEGGAERDVLYGEAGNDSLFGGNDDDDTLVGGEGADILNGGTGIVYRDYASYADSTSGLVINLRDGSQNTGDARGDQYIHIEGFVGSAFNDLIVGDMAAGEKRYYSLGAGNDTVIGGSSYEAMDGGDGIDTVSYQVSGIGVSVSLSAGGGGVNDSQSDTWVNFENVIGSNFKDSLTGDKGANYISGGLGNDLLIGLDGNDTLDGGSGVDEFQGGDGSDLMFVDDAKDYVREHSYSTGTDTVIASVSYDVGMGAVEVLQAAAGFAPINLTGNEYTHTLIGNEGSNILKSSGRGSVMQGGGGNDVYFVDNAGDQIVDTGGTDIVYATASFTLGANSGIDRVIATGNVAFLNGNAFDNILLGTSGKNTMNGAAGNDKIYGKGGKDVLTGGSGADWFVFDTKLSKSNTDTIKDFKVKTDKVVLDNALFSSNKAFFSKIKKGTPEKAVPLNKSFFTIGERAKDKDDYLVYNKKAGILYYDKDGAGSGTMVEIAKFSNKATLSYKDFYFI
jgi:Ca2+-binding RTX toxin-like protein